MRSTDLWRRLPLTVAILALASAAVLAALPATDTFTTGGASTTPISTYSASWTGITGESTPAVNQTLDQVQPNAVGSDSGAYWNADAFGAAHYSQVRVIAAANASIDFVSACVRVQVGARQYYKGGVYGAIGGSVGWEISLRNGGSNSVLTSGSTTVNANDILRLEVSGTTLTFKVNGSTIGTTSDGTLIGGAAGLFLFADAGSATDALVDDWEGGNVSAGAASPKRLPLMGVGLEALLRHPERVFRVRAKAV